MSDRITVLDMTSIMFTDHHIAHSVYMCLFTQCCHQHDAKEKQQGTTPKLSKQDKKKLMLSSLVCLLVCSSVSLTGSGVQLHTERTATGEVKITWKKMVSHQHATALVLEYFG